MNKAGIPVTPFGPVVVLWSADRTGLPRVLRVLVSAPGAPADRKASELFPGARSASCPEIDGLCSGLDAFLRGQDVTFPLAVARLDLCSPFQQVVLRAEHAIPRGSVSTYRLIAGHLGRPGAARAVGTALATNPFPLIVPCHRAVRTDRSLGGYQGGLGMKRSLLEAEGARFDGRGRLIAERFHDFADFTRCRGPCTGTSPRPGAGPSPGTPPGPPPSS